VAGPPPLRPLLHARTLLAHPVLPGLAFALALILRMLAWQSAVAPQQDELSYQSTASWLLDHGQQRLFWPPVTGWLIAIVFAVVGPSVPAARFLWLVLDLVNLVLLGRLASSVNGGSAAEGDPRGPRALRGLVMTGYALYLPAIGFAVHTTSEIPAVTLLLAVLLLLTPGTAAASPDRRTALAGLVAGALVLTRPSLALVPLALAFLLPRPEPGPEQGQGNSRVDAAAAPPWQRWRSAALLLALAAISPLAYVARNHVTTGEAVLAQNASYDFHRGNGPVYQEDLNLFWPVATPDQIAYRRLRAVGGMEPRSTTTPAQMRHEAFAFIGSHPLLFARRALGKLARLTVPRTEHLALLGGEQRIAIIDRRALALLVLGMAQFAPLLLLGTTGMFGLARSDRGTARRFVAVALALIPPVLITISKPRFGFVVEPLLLIAAAAFVLNAPAWRQEVRRPALIALVGLYAWSWLAWLVFAVTSRTGR
jgi:hypothetical protein